MAGGSLGFDLLPVESRTSNTYPLLALPEASRLPQDQSEADRELRCKL